MFGIFHEKNMNLSHLIGWTLPNKYYSTQQHRHTNDDTLNEWYGHAYYSIIVPGNADEFYRLMS